MSRRSLVSLSAARKILAFSWLSSDIAGQPGPTNQRARELKLIVATCQFPTSGDISANRDFVASLMRAAKTQGADVAHFPEACLSGYAGNDTAVLISVVDTEARYYDSIVAWRQRAMDGVLYSGGLVIDARSDDRMVI